jgi:hypothetical protein
MPAMPVTAAIRQIAIAFVLTGAALVLINALAN